MLTITHTPADGTVLDGTARGDGTAPLLKSNGWRWSHNLGAWYLPQSRDRLPKTWVIDRTLHALTDAGHEATVDVDTTARPTVEVEAAKAERQELRATHLQAKAVRTGAQADAIHDRVHEMCDAIPMGQPVMGARDRAYRDKIGRVMDRAYLTGLEAQETERRASAAARTTRARYNPVTVANRIAKLEAALRDTERRLAAATGDYLARLTAIRAQESDQLAYWQQVRADQIEAGTATNFSRNTVQPGDAVMVRGQWRRVVRANLKTVSVETGYTWTDSVPYAEIRECREVTG